MKITIESTTEVVLVSRSPTENPIPARVWEGATESGIKVQCLITRIAALKTEDLTQFDRELIEQREPSPGERAFPLRLLI